MIANSAWRRSRLSILCYHGISLRNEHEARPELYVTAAHFRRRLAQLKDGGYNVVQLKDGLRAMHAGTLPPRSVAITFDDGTRDFIEHAVPALREYAMPATVYITTYYADRPLPVFDTALWYLLWRSADPASAAAVVTGKPSEGRDIFAAFWNVYNHAKHLGASTEDKHQLLARVAEATQVDFDDFLTSGMYQQMTPDQIAKLPRDLIDIGLHTHRHRTPRDEAQFVREIRENRSRLDEIIGGATVPHFCYPSGDYDGLFLPWLGAEAIESATTCVPGLASRKSHPMLLPRFLDRADTSDITFDSWLTGIVDFIPRGKMHRLDPERLKVNTNGRA